MADCSPPPQKFGSVVMGELGHPETLSAEELLLKLNSPIQRARNSFELSPSAAKRSDDSSSTAFGLVTKFEVDVRRV